MSLSPVPQEEQDAAAEMLSQLPIVRPVPMYAVGARVVRANALGTEIRRYAKKSGLSVRIAKEGVTVPIAHGQLIASNNAIAHVHTVDDVTTLRPVNVYHKCVITIAKGDVSTRRVYVPATGPYPGLTIQSTEPTVTMERLQSAHVPFCDDPARLFDDIMAYTMVIGARCSVREFPPPSKPSARTRRIRV
jgi:hypothetical protein